MPRRALVIAICLLAGGCQASFPEARPLARGFSPLAGVLAPYEDGKLHLAAGRYGLAVERFGQALASDRRSLDALNGLAIAYARLGRFDVAQAYFERALEIDAFDAPTLNNYGRALLEQGRLRDARPFLQLALDHAAQGDLAVVAANLEGMSEAEPPALLAALRTTRPTPASASRRLVRLTTNRYRLETPGVLPAPPPEAVVAGPTRAQHIRSAPDAGVPLVLAGASGAALAWAADLDMPGRVPANLGAAPRSWASREAIAPRATAESRAAAPALASGEPT